MTVGREIYLDNAATTRPHPAVVEAMTQALTGEYGNPSSLHGKGLAAERLVRRAREAVAQTLGVAPEEIVFTSGGTESNSLAIRGLVTTLGPHRHLVTTAVEHSSVLVPVRRLAEEGHAVTTVPVDGAGRVSVERIAAALRPETVLVSVMAVNNELGTIQPIEEIGRLLRSRTTRGRPVYLHVDAVQAWGKIPLRPREWGVDLVTLSAHKVHGPKGVGALYVRRGLRLTPLLGGGDQEGGVRPGTENVPGIVGMGAAASLLLAHLEEGARRMTELRNRLRRAVEQLPDVRVNTPEEGAAPHILNVSFRGVRGETLLHRLEMAGVFVSTGSACHARDPHPSHVLQAIGLTPEESRSALRFSLSPFTTVEEIDDAAAAVAEALRDLRAPVR
ncbi:MAG: cysteine desulfurase family protein [Armatimonadota bacterium]|nr:cysteine desulfurase family protein [Armatimonadota bacterium]MDR7451775.1 cysteine desulfurase family protein [Armatimonadota bacterium]MDR7467400.1 cysteine desulfurase family protein [Armatimonadota bacterium]MDR7494170.1 cysteine desulfurase family protein [Armatimonadota bacterium]MDR7498864.1 cysteine desulfurase family protein [Armatimonadota bacterium]